MIDFSRINNKAMPHLESLLPELLPGGRIVGREYRCGDLTGGPGDSFGVNLDTGKWADFADTVRGGDPVSLVAAVHHSDQGDAARWLEDWLGIDRPAAPAPKKAKPADTWEVMPAKDRPSRISHPQHGTPDATWEYKGPASELLGIVCRFNTPTPAGEKQKKEIIPYTYGRDAAGNASWRWKSWGKPRPLYGLNRLAARPDAPAVVVEGEKATDAAQRLLHAVVSVTWPGGGKAVDKANFSPLQGRRVAIWPDNDVPGQKAAEAVACAILAAGAAEVYIIDVPPGKPEGWDLADAEADGWTSEQVTEWIKGHRRKIEAAAPVGNRQSHSTTAPIPLPDLPQVEPFDFRLLPGKLIPWVQDITERLQCPPDYVAVGAMVYLAAVIGRKIGIRPQEKTDWTVIPNLWGVVVGRPGVMKSPALEATSGPLDRLIAAALEAFKDAEAEAKTNRATAKLRSEAGEKAARAELKKNPKADVSDLLTFDDIEEPILRRYKTNDTNGASLGELLRQNPNGLLVYRDEMVSLLKGLDREDNASERGFFLTAWNGDSGYTLDRIGRGLHLHIEACCISLLGGTQPGKLSGYIHQAVNGGSSDDGLIQRFSLMVWPDVNHNWCNVDRYPDTAAKNTAYEVFNRLDKLAPKDIGAEQDTGFDGSPEGVPFLRFAPGALALFNEWRVDLEKRLQSGELHPALESHFSKYRKLVPALALIIHLADDGEGQVTEAATLKALAWSEYLDSHARRCYGSVTQKETQAAKAIKNKITQGALNSPFNVKDVWRPGWTGLDRESAKIGLDMLVDYGHLTVETKPTGGKPATLYHVVEVEP